MRRSIPTAVLLVLALGSFAVPGSIHAGGFLETFDVTGRHPLPDSADEIAARVIPIRWDVRCLPVPVRLNDTLDPIPNPLGADFLTLDAVAETLDDALDQWNDLRTSYFEAHRVGTVSNPDRRGFDTINEVTFRSRPLGGAAFSTSTTLMEDTVLVAGDDVDEDGDSDVAAGIKTCTDVDGDGDVEFPAGFYRAGTILDSDIELNARSNGFRFTVDPADIDETFLSIDLLAVLLHEIGHLQGLAHSMTNQISAADGTSVTMFAGIDTTDPDDERAFRDLEIEDAAAASFHYPEGTAFRGPAAARGRDVPFRHVFGVIEGEAFHGETGQPLAGGSVFAVDARSGRRVAGAVTGTVIRGIDEDGNVRVLPTAEGTLDGRYRLAAPLGHHFVGLESADGTPLFASQINETTRDGSVNRQVDFLEEFFNRGAEDAVERSPGRGVPVSLRRHGKAAHRIDFVTERSSFLRPFDTDLLGPGLADQFISIEAPAGSYYAVRFPASELEAVLADEEVDLVAGRFHTFSGDRSQTPVYEEALLAPGRLRFDGTAEIDLHRPYVRHDPFPGQDNDLATLYFRASDGLTDRIREGLAEGDLDSLFLVLRVPLDTPFPGVSEFPPLIGIDLAATENLRGRSFTSVDGTVFEPSSRGDFRFELVTTSP